MGWTCQRNGASIRDAHEFINGMDDLIEDDPSQANDMAFCEMRKDVDRLKIITERFSKIGSDPVLEIRPMDVVLKKCCSLYE